MILVFALAADFVYVVVYDFVVCLLFIISRPFVSMKSLTLSSPSSLSFSSVDLILKNMSLSSPLLLSKVRVGKKGEVEGEGAGAGEGKGEGEDGGEG